MWKLTIEDDEGKPTSLPLVHDEYTLGRGETNAIRLTDRNVSRKHAVLKKNGVGWVLQDLQSYNGTFVNNERVVGDRNVAPGDIMLLGDYRLFLADEAATTAGDQPMVTPPSPVMYRPNRLVVVVGPAPGTEFPLDKDKFTIGRSEEATISINHSSVSRIHAELIALGGNRFEIIDKGSANGIRVNGVDLRQGILEAGDALELGDVRLRFVGAGKVFRHGGDQSQTLPAVPGVPTTPGSASKLSTGKLVAILLAALAVIVVLVYFVVKPGKGGAGTGTNGTGTQQIPEDGGAALLAEAKKIFDGGDIEAGHQKAISIPEGSPARDDAVFKAIENGWADSLFDKIEKATDNGEKRKLLNRIVTTPTVDAERRKKATEQIAKLPDEPAPTPGGPYIPGPGGPATATTSGPTTSAPTGPTGATPVTPGQAPAGAIDIAKQRAGLEGKVWSGRASLEEIRLLKAICGQMGDRACRDRAAAMYKQKLAEQQK